RAGGKVWRVMMRHSPEAPPENLRTPCSLRSERVCAVRCRSARAPESSLLPRGGRRGRNNPNIFSLFSPQQRSCSEFVLHSLRITYLTRLGLAGLRPLRVIKLAGHDSVTVNQRYVHPPPGDGRCRCQTGQYEEALDKIDRERIQQNHFTSV